MKGKKRLVLWCSGALVLLRGRKPLTGFTLVEILIAVTILIVVGVVAFTTFRGGTAAWRQGTAHAQRHAGVRASLEMMSRELSKAMLIVADGDYQIDFVGTASRIYFVGSLETPRRGQPDLVRVRYDLHDGNLRRSFAQIAHGDITVGFGSPTLASDITDVTFEFFDAQYPIAPGDGWRDNWDSRTQDEIAATSGTFYAETVNTLPNGVRIKLRSHPRELEHHKDFSIVTELPRARPEPLLAAVSVSPSAGQVIRGGASITARVRVTLTGGAGEEVRLETDVVGSPIGISHTLSEDRGNISFTSELTLGATLAAPVGTRTIRIRAYTNKGAANQKLQGVVYYTLTVVRPFEFTLTVNPAEGRIPRTPDIFGFPFTITTTVTATLPNYTEARSITLLPNTPTGTTVTLYPTSLTPTDNAILTVRILDPFPNPDVVRTITITGTQTGGGVTETATFPIRVNRRPSPPTLVSPPDGGGTGRSLTPTLICNPATDADTGDSARLEYYFEVWRNDWPYDYLGWPDNRITHGFAGPAGDREFRVGQDGNAVQLAANTNYWWRVRVTDGFDWSSPEWSAKWRFTTKLPAPRHQSPAHGAAVPTRRPTLICYPVDGVGNVQYEFDVDYYAGLWNWNDATSRGLGDTSFEVGVDLAWNTLHRWRIRARDDIGFSDWSGWWEFTPTNHPPTRPNPISPAGTIGTRRPTLTWSASIDWEGNPIQYHFYVQDYWGAGLGGHVTSGSTSGTSFTVGDDIPWNDDHRWRVRAQDNYGHCSGWSDWRHFTPTNHPPSRPNPISPTGTTGTRRPTLTWSTSTDPEGNPIWYYFEVYWYRPWWFDELITSGGPIGGTSFTVGVDLTWGREHRWRVRARDNYGHCSGWSDWWHFTPTNHPPSVPVHRSPADDTTVPTQRPTLICWASIDPDGDSIRYYFDVDYDAGWWWNDRTSGWAGGFDDTNFEVGVNLAWDINHAWRVRAEDIHGHSSDWSVWWHFTPVEPLNFTLSVSPNVQAVQGGTGLTTTVTATYVSGATTSVTTSTVGTLPAGVTIGNHGTITPTGSRTLTIGTTTATPLGNHTITIQATGGGTTREATFTLSVFNYTLAIGSVTNILRGTSDLVSVTATLTAGSGTAAPVTIGHVTPLPGGVTITEHDTITPTTAGAVGWSLVSTTTGATLGNHSITINATGGGGTRTAPAFTQPVFDYTLSASPLSVSPGDGGTTTVTATLTTGSGTAVSVTTSHGTLPAGVGITGHGTITPTLAGATRTLTVTTTATTPPGAHSITITATGGGGTRTATFTLTVLNFLVSVSPTTREVWEGLTSELVTVTVSGALPAGQNVTLSVTTALPTGATATFSQNNLPPPFTSNLTIRTSAAGESVGNFTINIRGIGGGLTRDTDPDLILTVLDTPSAHWHRRWYGIAGSTPNVILSGHRGITQGSADTLGRFDHIYDDSLVYNLELPRTPFDNITPTWRSADNTGFWSIREIDFGASASRTFTLGSDDGARLWVGDTLLISRWIDQGYGTSTGTATLAGWNTIRVEYYEGGGNARIRFWY